MGLHPHPLLPVVLLVDHAQPTHRLTVAAAAATAATAPVVVGAAEATGVAVSNVSTQSLPLFGQSADAKEFILLLYQEEKTKTATGKTTR